ncbi:MAG: DNA polymerase III subunit chi [Pseudomonadota bacterium]
MADMLFYHLERDPLERVLPPLLEKSLERGWRSVVQVGNEERMRALDTELWTWRDESFLPHSCADQPNADRQPVLLTLGPDNENGAQIRFLVDGASIDDPGDYQRLVYLFDGHDPNAVTTAREMWRWAKGHGLDVTYWQQSDRGAWQKRG